ncbi:CrcB-like protein-domain-containing protein [Phialemonium atrogriseum]|uniref:CrcB-like protein-domain-containing protein n=1 Tax=Phialemonium atrogriseum TaxID=1093897 RepID=A0AAJ0C6J5_9PEZI|nr:CrcB-like protein-domain-containing protein [Phialemonium atrogriseum]KAK1768591.1 CrcB-like protein-domain-containing protein [Phialemonium atrogriseum]
MSQQPREQEGIPPPGADSSGNPDDDDDSPSPFSSPVSQHRPADHEIPRSRSRDSRIRRNERRASRPSVEYDIPDAFRNDDLYMQPPVQNLDGDGLWHVNSLEDAVDRRRSLGSRRSHGAVSEPFSDGYPGARLSRAPSARECRNARRQSTADPVEYDVPDEYANLDEMMDVSPVQNPDEDVIYRHRSLEQVRNRGQEYMREQRRRSASIKLGPRMDRPAPRRMLTDNEQSARPLISRLATKVYTISYLIFFAILGTLARLGLQALTYYPGAPVIFSSIWPNFGGSLFLGFLAEDRMLFRDEWGTPTYENLIKKSRRNGRDEETGSGSEPVSIDLEAAKRAYAATKKTIPLYIGLATGFCGSFTSFSSFIRDAFLALSNDLPTPAAGPIVSRNGGYSFMALLAVILLTVSVSLAGLFAGAHLAIALEPVTPSLPHRLTRKVLDRLVVVLGPGCWVGAVLLSALPPHDSWRGRATVALALAPLGCLVRFYASLYLNGRVASFPLGTFSVNTLGTAVMAMAWDLAHASGSVGGGVVACQVLQGVEDGFCGCLTTVSTWVAELAALRRRHAYVYGSVSVLASLALTVAIMGGLRWSDGFGALLCTH